MRKTISLKLTSQEEEIISSMRKKGMSSSTIIREALWKYIQENENKPYKEVNQVNHFSKEKKKQDNRKVYNVVNQIDQKVNHSDNFLREKKVYQSVNHVDQSHASFFDQYIYELHVHMQQLESELQDWKMRYTTEIQYWKETYQLLQIEYQDHVKDSTKRVDDKFDRIMFYIEESRKNPMHSLETSSDIQSEKQKKKWTSQIVRM